MKYTYRTLPPRKPRRSVLLGSAEWSPAGAKAAVVVLGVLAGLVGDDLT
jgi:hypothetical protein